MKLTCTLSCSSPPETGFTIQLMVASHQIASPLLDRFDPAEEVVDVEEGAVELQLLLTSRFFSPQYLPLQLIEPCDDLEEAEANYQKYGGYRYIGQVLLPDDQLGERVDVTITRDALLLWDSLVVRSERHQRVKALWQQAQDALFQLSSSEYQVIPTDPEVAHLRLRLRSLSADLRKKALVELHKWAPVVPLAEIFPLLNDPEEQVRQTALALLHGIADTLPTERLYTIACAAPLPARIAAITLLGAQRHRDAAQRLTCLALTGASRRERASERIALLRAYAQACSYHPQASVEYLDLYDILAEVAETDPLVRVRQAARNALQMLHAAY